MKFNNYSGTFTLENGADMLVYLEHDGEDTIIHHVMWPDGMSIDFSRTIQTDDIDMVFEAVSQEEAQTAYDDHFKAILEFETGEDNDSDSDI